MPLAFITERGAYMALRFALIVSVSHRSFVDTGDYLSLSCARDMGSKCWMSVSVALPTFRIGAGPRRGDVTSATTISGRTPHVRYARSEMHKVTFRDFLKANRRLTLRWKRVVSEH